jgi:Carbohydrate family 9 binding domain-like
LQVRDQFVDDHESDRDHPQRNDSVEIFLDGDRVTNDFHTPNGPPCVASSEGFQLLVDAAGHRATTSIDFSNNDWTAAASRNKEGYVIEAEIPLALIDIKDGPRRVAAGPGSTINLGLAINDNDTAINWQMCYAFIRARPSVGPPFIQGENSWSFGIKLALPGPDAN